MADQRDTHDLRQDAPSSIRLWWWFWRGWRKAMIGLVVLVAVAWGTNPDASAHARRFHEVHRSRARAQDLTPLGDSVPHPNPPGIGFPPPNPAALLFAGYRDFWVCSVVGEPGRPVSVGAFGLVWVLD